MLGWASHRPRQANASLAIVLRRVIGVFLRGMAQSCLREETNEAGAESNSRDIEMTAWPLAGLAESKASKRDALRPPYPALAAPRRWAAELGRRCAVLGAEANRGGVEALACVAGAKPSSNARQRPGEATLYSWRCSPSRPGSSRRDVFARA